MDRVVEIRIEQRRGTVGHSDQGTKTTWGLKKKRQRQQTKTLENMYVTKNLKQLVD